MENREQTSGLTRSSWLSTSVMLGSLVLVIGVLYFGKEIFVPIALSVLLTFVLAPFVSALRRYKFGRNSSVIVVVVLTFLMLGGIGLVIVHQLRSLANDLPTYRHNISRKIVDLKLAVRGGSIEKVQQTVKGVIKEVNKEPSTPETNSRAVPVVVTNQETKESTVTLFRNLLSPLATTGLVIVLVIFMLLRREDLRDRLIRLAGSGSLATTTKAIDEAGKRVSKYLVRQFLLNSSFGLAVGFGLFIIGLPYAILWGVLAGVARFIPYAGPIMGATAPILMSLAIFENWTAPLLVIGLMLALELVTNMLIEPLIYGQSIGVSEVALLIMIAFWTWLWGAIGMVLAAPLTVCLMVISKSVPDLGFIGLLLSSEPALAPDAVFYQRLVAGDTDEAREFADTYLDRHSRVDLYDNLLIPALISCRSDHRLGRLTDHDERFAYRLIRQITEETGRFPRNRIDSAARETSTARSADLLPGVPLIGYPAHDEAEELALLMLAELMNETGREMNVLSPEALVSDVLAELEKSPRAVVCVGCLPGGSHSSIRLLYKRLEERLPDARVFLGCWLTKDLEGARRQFAGVAAECASTLLEARNQLIQLANTAAASGSGDSSGSIHAIDSPKSETFRSHS